MKTGIHEISSELSIWSGTKGPVELVRCKLLTTAWNWLTVLLKPKERPFAQSNRRARGLQKLTTALYTKYDWVERAAHSKQLIISEPHLVLLKFRFFHTRNSIMTWTPPPSPPNFFLLTSYVTYLFNLTLNNLHKSMNITMLLFVKKNI